MSNTVTDNFTGSAATNLSAHTPDVGTAPSYAFSLSTAITLNGSGAIILSTAGQGHIIYPDTAPTADQQSTATLTPFGNVTDAIFSIWVREDSTQGGETGYEFRWGGNGSLGLTGTWSLIRWNNGSFSILASQSATLASGTPYAMTLSAVGTTISATATGGISLSATDSVLAGGASQRKGGIMAYSGSSNLNLKLSGFTFASISTTLTPNGNLIVNSNAPSAVVINCPYAQGVAPITFAWYRSTTVNFTPGGGNLLSNGGGISGATTATLTDGSTLIAGVTYYYVCIITDNVSTTFTTYHRAAYLAAATLKIGIVGDSTSAPGILPNASQPPSYFCQHFLTAVKGIRTVTRINAAVSGTVSADWYNAAGSGAQGGLTGLLASCGGSFTGWYIVVRLGVNDAQGNVTSAVYLANMTGLVNYIVTNGGTVILSYPLPREPGLFGETSASTFLEDTTPLLIQYLADLDGLINGTTIQTGDITSFKLFSQNPQTYFYYSPGNTSTTPGAIHENVLGSAVMGQAEAQAIQVAAGLLFNSGGSTITNIIVSRRVVR